MKARAREHLSMQLIESALKALSQDGNNIKPKDAIYMALLAGIGYAQLAQARVIRDGTHYQFKKDMRDAIQSSPDDAEAIVEHYMGLMGYDHEVPSDAMPEDSKKDDEVLDYFDDVLKDIMENIDTEADADNEEDDDLESSTS